MSMFDEYEAELLAKDSEMSCSGEWDKKMDSIRKKSEAENARMVANGAIQTEPDDEEDEEEDQ